MVSCAALALVAQSPHLPPQVREVFAFGMTRIASRSKGQVGDLQNSGVEQVLFRKWLGTVAINLPFGFML